MRWKPVPNSNINQEIASKQVVSIAFIEPRFVTLSVSRSPISGLITGSVTVYKGDKVKYNLSSSIYTTIEEAKDGAEKLADILVKNNLHV